MRRRRPTTVSVNWILGPEEIECDVHVKLYPEERCVMYDKNGDGYPGHPAFCEIIGAEAIEDGKKRKITDEELGWLEEAGAEIEAAAFAEAG